MELKLNLKPQLVFVALLGPYLWPYKASTFELKKFFGAEKNLS